MRKKGIDGESYASDYLKSKGYKILSKNFHSRFGELDIIANDKGTLVFVEVKLRTNSSFGKPLESITYYKIEKMKKTALYFMTVKNLNNYPFRFDAIEVELDEEGGRKMSHVKNITL